MKAAGLIAAVFFGAVAIYCAAIGVWLGYVIYVAITCIWWRTAWQL